MRGLEHLQLRTIASRHVGYIGNDRVQLVERIYIMSAGQYRLRGVASRVRRSENLIEHYSEAYIENRTDILRSDSSRSVVDNYRSFAACIDHALLKRGKQGICILLYVRVNCDYYEIFERGGSREVFESY